MSTDMLDQVDTLDEILRNMFMEAGVKLTEIGWEVADEIIQDNVAKLSAREVAVRIDELKTLQKTYWDADDSRTLQTMFEDRIKELEKLRVRELPPGEKV